MNWWQQQNTVCVCVFACECKGVYLFLNHFFSSFLKLSLSFALFPLTQWYINQL